MPIVAEQLKDEEKCTKMFESIVNFRASIDRGSEFFRVSFS